MALIDHLKKESQGILAQSLRLHLVNRQEVVDLILFRWRIGPIEYGRSSYCGIHPVLWDGQLLCFEMIEDKSSITDVVETCMKVIWVFNNHGQKPNCSRDIWMCWFGQFWGWIFSHFEALRRTDLLTKPFKELLIFQVVLIWLSIG